jgi:hypothetical protein
MKLTLICRFVKEWVYYGEMNDAYGEFMITVNDDYLRFRGGLFKIADITCRNCLDNYLFKCRIMILNFVYSVLTLMMLQGHSHRCSRIF